MTACEFAWCEQSAPEHVEHMGVLGTAVADGNEVEVRIFLDPGPKDDELLTYSFDLDWSIAADDGVREIAALRSIFDQISAIVTAAEAIYPARWRDLFDGVAA